MRVAAPNILDNMEVYVMMKVGKHHVACRLTRVYYHDTAHERRLWVDVRVIDEKWLQQKHAQRLLIHVAMENLDYRNYATIVSLSFQQEESDLAFQKHIQEHYACHVDMRLTQEYDDGYYWQGVLGICQRPLYGNVFVRGKNIPLTHFMHVCITPIKPLVLCVKDHNRIKLESRIAIAMGDRDIPLVVISSLFMYVTVHIGGKLFSGRHETHAISSGRVEYGTPTAAL
jgi:hypothetical protein